MTTQLLFTVLLMAAAVGYTVYVRRKTTAGMPAAFRVFFERTGYRYADILDQPLEAHIMHGQNLVSTPGGYHIHMVRDFHGIQVHSEQSFKTTREGRTTTITRSGSWWTPLAAPPRLRVQFAERSLSSTMKAVREIFGNSERHWQQQYPVTVASGDPELDARFLLCGDSEASVRHVLATPGLRELLLGCAELDLCVYDDRIVCADPTQKNLTAAMGGQIGNMAIGLDMTKRMELTIPVHDRMAQLLGVVASAIR